MAIQIPNPGTGNGATGDNEFVLWTKVKDNFSNTTHAASKIVGEGAGQVLQAGAYGLGKSTWLTAESQPYNTPLYNTRFYKIDNTTTPDLGITYVLYGINFPHHHTGAGASSALFGTDGDNFYTFQRYASGAFKEYKFYTTANTTKEEGTGYLVASSPVLKMQHDSFEKVHEAEQLEIEVNNIKTGVYEITGTTGLREGDGWNLKPPKDVNGNVLCICEASESNGVITLKTYKKKFDFETVSIVADYEQPTDIPEGATVMLRFNDLPQEQLDEPIE